MNLFKKKRKKKSCRNDSSATKIAKASTIKQINYPEPSDKTLEYKMN